LGAADAPCYHPGVTSPRKAARTACFQPDEYKNLALFANRSDQLEELTGTLHAYLESGAPGKGCILVRGHRGVGKSMLTRRAIESVRATHGPLTVVVDGARAGHGPEAFLRQLAKDLAQETLENVTKPVLGQAAELLLRFAGATDVSVKQAQEWTQTVKLGLTIQHKFGDLIGFEFGLARAAGKSRKLEETYQRKVDAELLRELIQALVYDCHEEKQRVVLLLDNLDQVGYAEIEEDVRRVTDLARYLFGLEGCLLVASMRNEFVSADLLKLSSQPIEVSALDSRALMEIFDQRVARRGPGARTNLEEAGLVTIARTLSTWTGNAWAFLSWLAYLDFQSINFDPEDQAALRAMLRRFAAQTYTGVRAEELDELVKPYRMHQTRPFLTGAELSADGIPNELIERAKRYGVLVPDWLLSPDRYQLAPTLCFLLG
jgi:AAA ATPase domain